MSIYDRSHPGLGKTRNQIAAAVRSEKRFAYIAVDLGAPIVIAVFWMLIPFEATLTDRIIGLIGLLLLAPLDLGIRRFVDARWSNYAVLASRSVVVIAITLFVPAVWVAVTAGLGTTTVGAVPVENRTRIMSLIAINAAGLSLTGIVGDVGYWYLTVLVVVIVSVFSDEFFREWNAERLEVDRRHDEMLDRAHMISWAIDRASGTIVSLVGNVEGVLGYRPEELTGRPVQSLISNDERRRAFREPTASVDGEVHSVVHAAHQDGHEVVLQVHRLEHDDRDVVRGVAIDTTELARASAALRHQAEHDVLTDLANRSIVERELIAALSADEPESTAILVADLDRFKEINDTLGHPTGDHVLLELADRFRSELADLDVVARIGGDEFAFVVRGVDAREAERIGGRIHELVSKPLEVGDLTLAAACSVGVAIAPDHGSNYADLMKHADIATYAAKRSGGGVQVYESTPGELSLQRLQLTSEVGNAVSDGGLELFFQPQVDLTTGAIVAVEGLARWRHPEFGLLLPESFLDVVEVSADYHRFSDEMVRQAVEFAAVAAASGHMLNVAVNLGSMSFLDQSLPDRIGALLAEHAVAPDMLTLEVTESDLLDEHGADVPVFDALNELGVRLSIDDFGTGYSTLTRLRALDVDEVKIDRQFVAGLGDEGDDAIIVGSVVQLCRQLGHSVVGEGVETPEQMAVLQRFGCETAQGFLFAEAMSRLDMFELLVAGTSFDVGDQSTAALATERV